jgi:hypothetical protein
MDKAARLSHSVTLLKKLISVGIPTTEYGYSFTKKVLDKWISDGKAAEAQIEFVRYGRIGHLSLFVDTSPKFVLKATDELKEQVAANAEDT